ncbi:MAG: CRISPR-associated endonuclease Cas1 [Candidatus Methanofastidiosum methylothiophilum]|uniref:CRISPR-associated endonuclease Cas1 n=1 Tax=Candidatus Methanofastidiosum methylothiophilum TaxID=1705564 RepID=A0A150INV8_9EURY|nr:MAG: CRISPR-associated endonuclease Cas1 [Candidatus Methanofastidiosum methylthiophilus]KYC46660.1 MAG: CRISPR-associated endonuclease Cas1 [Candidatus Methanofastidiosum methylthiophilus]KYC49074.1 MAG: CRISPR-associated endonuclease Cas1 [Candidatus Methanofastidiosum methylthiophilus]
MKEPLYIVSEGILKREGNTLFFLNKDEKKALPIERLSDIYCYGKVTLKSGASSLVMKAGLPVHFFNHYGYYEGSLYPKEQLNSGLVVVEQSRHYLDKEKRIKIASEFVEGISHNILQTLKYYQKKYKDLEEIINNIESLNISGDIPTLRAIEGEIWENYYKSFPKIIKFFEFNKRERRPPSNELNALISFGNSLLYSTVLSEIYNTYLHPSISYLHEPLERRFSLSLDIADVFKPIIIERLIFNLVNNKYLSEEDFDKDLGVLLNEKGKRIFLKEYKEKLETTVKHPTLKRKVSYRYLIRLECYKIMKHILGDKEYKSFRMWW